ncbi:PaaI family thioesterase [Nocardia sp. NPDC052566]|uniref:PaaI family thioesterase n=1 Tax=Nocardia sp. NPDC052566 TaxID=3364330 RepID=UPI0037CBCEE2
MIQVSEISIPDYVHGFPDVAFGGYVAGLLAKRSGAPRVRVDFRAKVPVGEPIVLASPRSGAHTLTGADGTLLAEASPAVLRIDPPPVPSWADAHDAAAAQLPSGSRRVTDCYGCGTACAPGRGLLLHPCAAADRELTVAAWSPHPALAGADGQLPPEVVWAALDCPGGWAAITWQGMRPGSVTAALTATQLRPVLAGAQYISYAWPIHREGRKFTVGVGLATASGELCALAEALWIQPEHLA